MNLRLGDTHTFRWPTHDPTTAAATNPSAQTLSIYEENSDTALVTPTITTVAPGHHRADGVLTTANGFEAGKKYAVWVEATIGGVAMKACIETFKLETVNISEIPSAVWEQLQSSHMNSGTMGLKIDDIYQLIGLLGTAIGNAPAAIWSEILSGYSTPGMAGKIISDLTDLLDPAFASSISDAVGARTVDGAFSWDDVQLLILAFVAGKTDGGGTTTINFRRQDGTTAAITMTVNDKGDRSVVVTNVA